MIPALVLGEFSNPFLIARNIFDFRGEKKKGVLAGIGFMSTFLTIRAGILPFVVYGIQMAETRPLMKIFSAFMWFVSLIWVWKIANLGVKILKEFYKFMIPVYEFLIKMRPYQKYYNVLCVYWSFRWIVFYYLGITWFWI